MTEQEFWAALAPGPLADPPKFRLYHDAKGWPLFYSMQHEPGLFEEIDHATYVHAPTPVRVVNGQLKYLHTATVNKLTPADSGTACAPEDVCVVVDATKPHIKWNRSKHDTD